MKHSHRQIDYIEQSRHPLLHDIARQAEWMSDDEFPAAPEWADEHEKWLRFIERKGEISRFLPRLIKAAFQRDRAFAEIGIAYFLETMCSLPITEWEPDGEAGMKGEFMVGSTEEKVFVEVKVGGWEKDIKEVEGRASPRLSRPKYIHAEARSVAPWAVIRHAVSNAYRKMPKSMPTLLIIKDDYWINLDEFNADLALYCPMVGLHETGYLAENGCFVDKRYEHLAGVGIFNVELSAERLRYSFFVCENSNAIRTVQLPEGIFQDYARYNGASRPNGQG